ncbi:putative ATPase [Leptomonas pyrrhocoris]|uniref:Putative ATPase n=1 Tax=Leptomonas pyrrhocoris TaxID=157538 RepID=A0A0N0VHL3_LEPPY|nr:putative ATPase [Leptomonas pyrrhocoris]KPA85338.1 putative ATPase [Leptomonas pyrrhocoris]|eukprot:XP_015663777.1 putative ATPase [Leptomonas pyrrhocoris]
MTCTNSSVDARNRPSAAVTPLSQMHDLLVSLLHWWPYSPSQQCPSFLLCGPTANGKSHLVRRVVHDANNTAQCNDGKHDLASHESRRHVVSVTPRLAQAAAVQDAKDGCTGLRRLLRRTIHEACTDALGRRKEGDAVHAEEPVELAVLVVFNHVECYWTHGGESYVNNGEATSTSAAAGQRNGEDAASTSGVNDGLNTLYPSLLADLYTVFRSAPPLFSQAECAALRLSTVVYVSLFTGELDQVQPTVRQRYVDYALSLPTPTEAERTTFFRPFTQSAHGAAEADGALLPVLLADALVLRTGGASYGGLQEIVALALEHVAAPASASSSPANAGALPHTHTATQWGPQTAGAAAQCILHAYQTSLSITALEYRRSAGFVDVQVTLWDDIAGMSDVKATLRRLVTDPIRHRDAYCRFHVRPSTGVLLHGPPGTGKTLLAKAMATELNASFVYMDLPELVQSELGESERRLQAYFDVARERSPSVVFMDEVQAAFGVRYGDTTGRHDGRPPRSSTRAGGGGDAGRPVSTTSHDARLVSHLLRLLDAAQQDEEHFVLFVGATNVVHLLDPLLLRAGRLDTLLEVPLPDTAARESLVKRVVYGEWSQWFSGERDAAESVSVAEDAQRLDRIQAALVDEFVRLSDGFSGAQVRNFLSVFGLQLARTVSRGDWSERERNQPEREGGDIGAAAMGDEAAQRQCRLQDAITRLLTGEDSSEALSRAALDLILSSHARSLS